MARLIEIKQTELQPTLRALSDAGMTTEDADWIRSGNHAVAFMDLYRQMRGRWDKNPFELSVEEQLNRLGAADDAGSWGLKEEDFMRLAETAPAWPKGFDSFRGIRVRLGEGRAGVIKTFEAHALEIKRVFTEKGFWRWELLLSGTAPYKGKDTERLRLLNGNDTHKPCVEWFITDLNANRQRSSITAVRGKESLADDGLSIAWMFPERVKAIDYDKLAAWFLAGYELNVPENDDESWYYVPIVDFRHDDRQVDLRARGQGSASPGYSVPSSGSES